jgi:hypothetical protein
MVPFLWKTATGASETVLRLPHHQSVDPGPRFDQRFFARRQHDLAAAGPGLAQTAMDDRGSIDEAPPGFIVLVEAS